jgi:hypothetical protein
MKTKKVDFYFKLLKIVQLNELNLILNSILMAFNLNNS